MVDRGPVRVIRNEYDYNRYCYYVAGTVGHLVTRLCYQPLSDNCSEIQGIAR